MGTALLGGKGWELDVEVGGGGGGRWSKTCRRGEGAKVVSYPQVNLNVYADCH